MLVALQSESTAMSAEWPKEYRDLLYGACVIDLLQGSDPSDGIRQAIESSCQCTVEETQRVLSVQDLRDLQSLPADKRNSSPKGKLANKAGKECEIKYKVDAKIEEELIGPISQNAREVMLMYCVWGATKENPGLVGGKSRIADACLCGINQSTSKFPTLKEWMNAEADVESIMEKCMEMHAPKQIK